MASNEFKCSVCGKGYRYEKKLKRHVAFIHDKSTEYVCKSCGRKVSSEAKLMQHQKSANCGVKKKSKKVAKIYVCDKCDHTFPTLTLLRKHIRDHNKKQVKHTAKSTRVFFEPEQDVDKCLHARVTRSSDPQTPNAQQQADAVAAVGVEDTWR